MVECKGCRALEFITDGIRRGSIMDIQVSEPRYNCCCNNKIILVNGSPCCEDCKDKTTARDISKRKRKIHFD